MKKILQGTGQVALLYAISFLLDRLLSLLHLAIPNSMLGIAILLLLLHTKIIREEWFEIGANWLLTELLLFFIPSAVGIIDYQNVFIAMGIQVIGTIFLSTTLVMIFAGLSAQLIAKFKVRNHSC
ncbi:MAG: ywbH [Firmicutes bacterium]|nr:ywbH [Bacillota bacterium]